MPSICPVARQRRVAMTKPLAGSVRDSAAKKLGSNRPTRGCCIQHVVPAMPRRQPRSFRQSARRRFGRRSGKHGLDRAPAPVVILGGVRGPDRRRRRFGRMGDSVCARRLGGRQLPHVDHVFTIYANGFFDANELRRRAHWAVGWLWFARLQPFSDEDDTVQQVTNGMFPGGRARAGTRCPSWRSDHAGATLNKRGDSGV